jgi:hypothetical protein
MNKDKSSSLCPGLWGEGPEVSGLVDTLYSEKHRGK